MEVQTFDSLKGPSSLKQLYEAVLQAANDDLDGKGISLKYFFFRESLIVFRGSLRT